MQFNNPASIKTMTILHLRNSIDRSPLRLRFLLIPLALTWFALSPTSFSQLPSPAPDGGYPNGNTAEGDGGLNSLTTGSDNTATGFKALFSNTTGNANTALVTTTSQLGLMRSTATPPATTTSPS